MLRVLPLAVAAWASIGVCVAADENRDAPRLNAIDAYIEAEMSRQHIPGVALAIVKAGVPLHIRGYGLANVEHQVPVHVDTVFQSGSIGKPFTAMAVMLMAEEGKLQLDASIRSLLPEAPAQWQRITLRHLLNHTSGIAEPKVDLRRDYTDAEFLQAAFSTPLISEPGQRWRYSSMGYLILGIVVSRGSGEFYGELLRKRVFEPLGMRTARIISERDIIPNRAAGYELTDEGIKNQQWVAPNHNRTADGTLYLSALDYAQWEGGLRSRAVLQPSSWREILQPAALADGTRTGYGFGWELTTTSGGQRIWSHGGGWQGFRTYFRRYDQDEVAFALMANLDVVDTELMVDRIAAIFDVRYEGAH